jgi:site-specific DNA-cytosine methylase
VVGPLCANAATDRKHGDGGISSLQQYLAGGIQPTEFGVRRLTPRECERLQAFPDDWTLIPWREKPREQCPDGPRYRVLGNAFAVPVIRWIGERIVQVDALNAKGEKP